MVERDVSGSNPPAIPADPRLPSPQADPNREEELVDMPENDDVIERLHAVETAQAVQAAVQAGAEATQGAVQAGAATTNAATHAGTWSAMVAGAAGLIVGIFLGLAIGRK